MHQAPRASLRADDTHQPRYHERRYAAENEGAVGIEDGRKIGLVARLQAQLDTEG
jgi:hypothetical protein